MANEAGFKMKAPTLPKRYVKRDLEYKDPMPEEDAHEEEDEPMYEQLRKKWKAAREENAAYGT